MSPACCARGTNGIVTTRIAAARTGIACFMFTASRTPVTLVYAEEHQTGDRAQKRERQIKRWTRAKKEALIAGDLLLLKRL